MHESTAARQPASSAAPPVSAQGAALSRVLCCVAFLPLYYACTALMRWQAGYRIRGVQEIRRRYQEIAAQDGPLIICANHLTFIDSALMLWAFGSGFWYIRHFNHFAWNLPAGDFFKKRRLFRFVGTISKCLFIHRDGSKQHKDSVVKLCTQLVRAGETVMIFPEGQRSRTGRFDPEKLTHGVGKMVAELGGDCRVLCVYLRGDQQESYTNYPARGSRFHLDMQLIHAHSNRGGREGYHEIVTQIGRTIKAMEDRYFEPNTRRHAAP